MFVPTGQTGIAIAGWGIAVDAVVADFLAGAAERLVVEGARRGGELLWVEGQGSLCHPLYSRRHARAAPRLARRTRFVLCHKAGATEIEGCPGHPIPPLPELVELHERYRAARAARRGWSRSRSTPAELGEDEARAAAARVEAETGLTADDPVRFGAGALLDAVLASLR